MINEKRTERVNKLAVLADLDAGMTGKEVAAKHRCRESYVTKIKKGRVLPLALPECFKSMDLPHQKFAVLSLEGKSGVDAAMEAFEMTNRDSAKAVASREKKTEQYKRSITELMNIHGLTPENRIKQLRKLVFSQDGNISLRALDQTWRLDGSYQPTEINVGISYNPEALRDRMQELRQMLQDAETIDI